MRLNSITLHNYRNFEVYTLSLGKFVTVLIGRNGMGKTNLLDAMVHSLSFIFSKQRDTEQYEFIKSTNQGVKRFAGDDPRFVKDEYYKYPISISATGTFGALAEDGSLIEESWNFVQESEKSGLKDSLFRNSYHHFWEYYNTQVEKPVLAYFSDGFPHTDNRISLKMREKINSGNPLPPNTGYYMWDSKLNSTELWKLYYIQEYMNNRMNPDARRQAFVDAVNNKLREFSRPMNQDNRNEEIEIDTMYVDVRGTDLTLMLKYANGKETPFNLMPAGYRRMFSMVLDIICRSYFLNNHCNSEGIVFIDEIDLHLHPSLAAEILPRLRRSFPRLQFIISTHSPLVITNFNQSEGGEEDFRLYQLKKNDEGYYNQRVYDIFGLDYNSGLSNIMETPISVEYSDNLIKAYRYWKGEDEEKATRIAEMIRQKYGNNNSIISQLDL